MDMKNALDEAINFCNDKLEDFIRKAHAGGGSDEYEMDDCYRYMIEYGQIAEFLKTLKAYREATKQLNETANKNYDSLFGDGIRFCLKVMNEVMKKEVD